MVLGDHHVIEMKPTGQSGGRSSRNSEAGSKRAPAAHVTINNHPAYFSAEQSATVYNSSSGYVVKVFARPNGEVTVKSEKFGLILKYYGDNIAIYVSITNIL